jgi:hypothetical protein
MGVRGLQPPSIAHPFEASWLDSAKGDAMPSKSSARKTTAVNHLIIVNVL